MVHLCHLASIYFVMLTSVHQIKYIDSDGITCDKCCFLLYRFDWLKWPKIPKWPHKARIGCVSSLLPAYFLLDILVWLGVSSNSVYDLSFTFLDLCLMTHCMAGFKMPFFVWVPCTSIWFRDCNIFNKNETRKKTKSHMGGPKNPLTSPIGSERVSRSQVLQVTSSLCSDHQQVCRPQ